MDCLFGIKLLMNITVLICVGHTHVEKKAAMLHLYLKYK